MGRLSRVETDGDPLGAPSVDEVLAAGRKAGIVKDEPDDNEEPESAADDAGTDDEETPETPEAKKAGKGQPRGTEIGEEDEPDEPGEEEQGLVVDGKRYTAQQIRDLERGYLREDHFTRQMQALRSREREVLEELKAAREERRQVLELQRSLVAGRTSEHEEEPEITDPAIKTRLQRLDGVIGKLEERLTKSEQERVEAETNNFIADTYEDVFGKLCERFKVPEKLRPALSRLIENDDPDVFDPETKRPSAVVIAKSVERAFRHWHDILLTQTRQRVQTETVDKLRTGTKAIKPKPKGGVPAKPEAPAHKSKLLPRKDRENREWDSHEAASEFVSRAAEMLSGAED